MKTYSSIKAEIARLEKQAEAARKNEVAEVIAKIKSAIDTYSLTAADLGLGRAAGKGGRKAGVQRSGKLTVGIPKYRDPETGKTWTGRGKPPAWIAGVKNRDPFLIDKSAAGEGEAPSKRANNGTRRGRGAAAAKKGATAGKRTRERRKPRSGAMKTPAVQMESGAASE